MKNSPAGYVVLEDVAIDRRIFDIYFACDLNACKGACCVEGDGGAPLSSAEAHQLQENAAALMREVPARGKEALLIQGNAVLAEDKIWETPLIEGKECAYVYFENGIAFCSIERAFRAGRLEFNKPVSCHLYPIRVYRKEPFDYLVYEEWSVCSPACAAGKESNIRVFEFVKDGLIRAYGEAFYEQLTEISKQFT